MKLTLAITAYNETRRGAGEWLQECIAPALEHPGVGEVFVVDDGSVDWLNTAASLPNHPKIRFMHLGQNLSVFGAKIASVCHAHGDWVQLCDSDNVMNKEYLDSLLEAILDVPWNTWICPSFARPVFDYRKFVQPHAYDLPGFASLIGMEGFECLANTGNMCVPRNLFDNVFRRYLGKRADLMFPNWLEYEDPTTEHARQVFNALDSFMLNLEWLTHAGRLWVVEDLEYAHRVTGKAEDSNYNRGPDDKDRMGKFLVAELARRAKSW